MHARRSHLRPARLVAIFMALLSLAVAIFWADSYRDRGPKPLFRETSEFSTQKGVTVTFTPDRLATVGLNLAISKTYPDRYLIRTCEGRVSLRSLFKVVMPASYQRIDRSWHAFSFSQKAMQSTSYSATNNALSSTEQFCIRELAFPFWFLFTLCVTIPTIFFIRGPLRRHKRRRRGLCIECGYDLRGSADQCPECGAQVIGPRGSCAAGAAGSSHAVIEGENAPSE